MHAYARNPVFHTLRGARAHTHIHDRKIDIYKCTYITFEKQQQINLTLKYKHYLLHALAKALSL